MIIERRQYMKKHSNGNGRFIAIAVAFCAICLVFVTILAVVQLRGTSLPPREEGYTRTYTVPGIRGEIYDRNGVKLVSNSDKYDLVYEYGAMPDTRSEVNLSLIAVMEAIRSTGNTECISDDYFILEGEYPNMTFVKEYSDTDSSEYYYYEKFLERQEMKASRTDENDVAAYFVGRYKLYDTVYTNAQITDLIRLYYEMERVGFGAYESYTIAEGVNRDLITFVEENNIEGVNFEIRSERVYIYPGIASHILGRLGRITAENADYYLSKGYPLDAYVGTSGCEEAFEEYLRGTSGIMVVKYDKSGNLKEKYYSVEPKSGNDVYLTIDIELQIAAEKALDENVDMKSSSDSGAVTAIDPKTGKVLAIASNPTYDLSKFDSKEYYNSLLNDGAEPLYNRALQGVYAPGSTYKIGVALAALEGGYITESDKVSCNHNYRDLNGNPTGHTCLATHGSINVVEAIKESCNVFFYRLGEIMNITSITKYTYKLGLGADTGLELGNKTGIVAGPEYREDVGGDGWTLGDDLNASIGQSDHGYTPLQMSVYMSSVVNGGTRYRSSLLDSVREFHTGEIIYATETEALYTLRDDEYSDETEELLKEAMRQAANEEPSRYLGGVPVTVGGKTGTSEVAGKKDYALFCGFAPLDTPEIVISCVIEEGEHGYLAAYTVGKIMERYFELYGADVQGE